MHFITHVPTFAFQPLGALPSRQMALPSLDEPWNVLCYRAAVVLQAFVRGALVRLLTDAPSSTFILGPASRKHHHASPTRRPVTAVSNQTSDPQVPALLDKIAGLEKTLHEMEGQLKQQLRRNLLLQARLPVHRVHLRNLQNPNLPQKILKVQYQMSKSSVELEINRNHFGTKNRFNRCALAVHHRRIWTCPITQLQGC